MFVGHGTLAFAAVGLLALARGTDRDRALALATAAGLFATVPDVDMIYALSGLVGGSLAHPVSLASSFWAASTVVHRSVTHSVILAVPATVAFALAGRSVVGSGVAVVVGAVVVAVAAVETGPVGALVAVAFVVAGVAVGTGAARYDLGVRATATAALVGLVSHPFGDVLTGQPPHLLYPLDASILHGRIALAADPTLHLLGAFAVEMAAIWIGLLTYASLREMRLRDHVRPRATAGAAYAIAIAVLPPPTLGASYPFVFSVLGVGLVGAVPIGRRRPEAVTAVVTGLAGVTVAWFAYTVAYLTVGVAPALPPVGEVF
ncbi:MAG: metal-dependent hydrolase [Halanaeroarchaeum sp.]